MITPLRAVLPIDLRSGKIIYVCEELKNVHDQLWHREGRLLVLTPRLTFQIGVRVLNKFQAAGDNAGASQTASVPPHPHYQQITNSWRTSTSLRIARLLLQVLQILPWQALSFRYRVPYSKNQFWTGEFLTPWNPGLSVDLLNVHKQGSGPRQALWSVHSYLPPKLLEQNASKLTTEANAF